MKKWIKRVYTKPRTKPTGFSTDLESNIYTLIILTGLLLLSLSSCSTIEPIEGLCYNDKDGTYLCPEKEEEPERDMEEFNPIYEYCEPWEFDPEAWMNCIMNEESRRNLIRRLA